MSSAKKTSGGGGGGGGGWGFGSIITNLESRLDTILAEDSDASARERAADEARRKAGGGLQRSNSGNLAPPSSKDAAGRGKSRERGNDRLAERLAKATAAKTPSQAGSAVPSRSGTPVIEEGGRRSTDGRMSAEAVRVVPEVEVKTEAETKDEDAGKEKQEDSTLLHSGLPINPARVSAESARPSIELSQDDGSERPSIELSNGHVTKSNAELEADMAKMREEYGVAEKQRQEEMHTYLEKIDALQAKLQYLARETVAAAKEANAATSGDGGDKKLAEKDEQIALLMEEGEKLSKTELRHLQTIKKLRSGRHDDEKATTELKRRLGRIEKSEGELKARLRRAEAAERQANEKTKQIAAIEKEVEELRIDRENAAELVRSLTSQLREAEHKADKAEKDAATKANEIDKGRIAALENDLEDAKIEKKLAEDRAASETAKLKERAESERQRSSVRELELKNEISTLESRVEAMRSRVEEGSAESSGEGSVKLLRQVETLQSQYSLAKANWEAIESSLHSRLMEVERERDDAARREGEVRRKIREVGLRARRAEEELETERERVGALEGETKGQRGEIEGLRAKVEGLEGALAEAKAEVDRLRRVWEAEMLQRVEGERAKWRGKGARNESPSAFPATSRKISSAEVSTLHSVARKPGGGGNRLTSHDLSALHTQHLNERPTSTSRRSSNHPQAAHISPSPSRQPSYPIPTPTNEIPPTPSLSIADISSSSGQRTLNDLMSTSGAPTASASGPSIQLVERLSTTIRRLESEKATYKDELARLSSQRDAAREEMVEMMRGKEEGEEKRRYEASLQLLGEREEEVEELKADVAEMRRLYKELVDAKTLGR